MQSWLSATRYGSAPNVQPTVRLLSFSSSTPLGSECGSGMSGRRPHRMAVIKSKCAVKAYACASFWQSGREGGVIPDIRYIFTTEWAGSERMDRHRGMSGIGASWTVRAPTRLKLSCCPSSPCRMEMKMFSKEATQTWSMYRPAPASLRLRLILLVRFAPPSCDYILSRCANSLL